MKYAFSRTVDYIPDWNGNKKLDEKDQVSVVLKPMELEDMFLLMDATSGMDGANASIQRVKDVVKNAGHLLPKYATLRNLTGETGEEITINDLVTFPAFLNLASEILMKLATMSMPSEATEGN